MQLRGLIFDMDGTLFDTERLALRAWEATEAQTGTRFPDDFVYRIVGANSQSAHRMAAEALGSVERAESFFDAFRELYHGMLESEGPPLKPGAREILTWARDAGLRLALATSTRREVADKKLAAAAFAEFFEVTVCGDEIENGKPAPDIFAEATDQLRLPATTLLALEDSPNGLRSAVAAGLRTILIPDLAPIEPEVRALAWKCADNLDDARVLLEPLLTTP